jgi:uncharacterized protein (DUF169 family)
MELEEMSKILTDALELTTYPVGVVMFRREDDIPEDLEEIKEATRYCQMVQDARLKGETSFACTDKHGCKGGAAGLGIIDFPLNISSGNLYVSSLKKNISQSVAKRVVSSFPRPAPGSTVGTLVGPLEKLDINPDVAIVVCNPFQARRIIHAIMYKHGGRLNFNTAGIQSFCVDATAVPYLTGDINISMGCDGAAKNAGLEDDFVVVGIPFEMLGDICAVLDEKDKNWDSWMRS